ncbi:MAG: hypothetical protein ABIR80_18425, partial [Opitutaceae bacterium]
RRGIVSTTAALTTALAHEAGVLAPAGLATSVTGAALASAAASGGVAAGWGISTLMSTTKLGAWGVAAAMLCASLVGNAYLLTTPVPPRNVELPSRVTAESKAEPAPLAAETPLTVTVAKSENLVALRDRLRAAGADEASIRVLLEGILRQRYRERLSVERLARTQRGWWRDPARSLSSPEYPMQIMDDRRLLREIVTLPLEELLGPDPLAVAEADARYAFLPPELRQAFGRLDRAAPASFLPTGQLEVDAAIEAEQTNQRRTIEEQRKALVDSLTPAQRLDWEMRNSPLATNLGRQLGAIEATEAEYRAVFPLADNYLKARNAKVPEGGDAMGARVDADQEMKQQLVAALGYDRALDFIWSGAMEYAPYARAARDANLPAATASQVMQLAAETAKQATVIHGDATLSVEQKRAALAALQQSVRPALDALVPPAVQQRLIPTAQNWFTGLSTGTYKPIVSGLPGVSGLMITMAQSVENPAPAYVATLQTLPPRPPAK